MSTARCSLVLLALVFAGCEAPEVGDAPGATASGVVVDGLDGRAIEGALVRSRDGRSRARTDAHGRFTLTLPAETTHYLWLSREGYVGGQRANVVAGESIEARLFPEAPSEEEVRAYFARQPVRRHAHPAHERPGVAGDVGAVRAPGGDPAALPETIRVWRAGGTALQPTPGNGYADQSCHADAVVLELPREEYVKGVIPHEWIPSWDQEALRAGAIAARTYAVSWALRGGRWDCADVDDGTVTQVYRDDRADSTNEAVDATAGRVVMRNGAILTTEYSAENANPTADGVAEPTCAGQDRFGHGRGMCQWGTQRWATASCANPPCDFGTFEQVPRDHAWMVEHYYPGSELAGEGVDAPPCALIGAEGGVLDDAGPCFYAFGPSAYWRSEEVGWEGGLRWTNAFQASAPSNWARWRLHFEAPGSYRVEVYVEPGWGVHTAARYEVEHAGGVREVTLDQGAASGWTLLGEFTFGEEGAVRLLDNEASPVPADQRIVADALRLSPAGSVEPVDGGGTDGGRSARDGGMRLDAGTPLDGGVGEAGGGCAVGGRATAPAWLLALALGALLWRRR